MSEKLFENKIKKWLKAQVPNVWFFKVWGGGVFQSAGIPDIIGCINGRFFALEIKDVNGKPSKLQEFVIAQMVRAGAYARFVYPKDYEQVLFELKSLLTK